MPVWLPIGLVAGLVSAVLYASAKTGTVIGVLVLFLLSPLPVAIAGLGWGWMSAGVAAVSGALLAAVIGGFRATVVHALAIGLPAAVLSYLVLLNRQQLPSGDASATLDRSPRVEWYPIGRVVALAALIGGALAALSMLATSTDVEGLKVALRSAIERALVAPVPAPKGAAPSITPEQVGALTELMTLVFAGVTATTWLVIASGNLWLAGRVARKSGQLLRPWPDLSTLALPRSATIGFAATVAGTFLPGYAGLISSGFAWAFGSAFTLVGLAIVHNVTRGNGARPLILTATYAALVLLNPFSGLILSLLGVAEPVSPLRRKPIPPPGSPFT
jgi:hypothetical protein